MVKLLSLFSGIGAFEKAASNINLELELLNYCEINKYARFAYSVIHNVDESYNLKDVTQIDPVKLKDFDLLTHGSPCQDFSLTGRHAGGDEGTGTRSSLMWYSVNIIREKRPKYVIWENVKGVLTKQHKHNFYKYIKTLEDLGYRNYYKVLNAADYGAPQARERIFVVSIRKDVKKDFQFKVREHRDIRLKDILEKNIDDKYYLENNYIDELISIFEKKRVENKTKTKLMKIGDIQDPHSYKMNNRVFSKEGVAPTLTTTNPVKIVESKVRRLTPLECWLTMGFTKEDYWKARKALEYRFYNGKDRTDSQMYRLAGNSIVVNVVEDILYELFI